MSLRRRLSFSSATAIVLGLIIILTPTLLLPNQVEYSGLKNDQSIEAPKPMLTPLPRESVDQSLPLPFMFEFDLDSSYGFERKYLLHETFGTPVFVISRGESATIVVLVSSLSNNTLQVSLEKIDGLPSGISARLEFESFILKPYEQKELDLEIIISPTARTRSTPEPIWPIDAEFVQLVLRGDRCNIGTGFLLRIA